MTTRLLPVALLLGGCGLIHQSFVGRACDASHACPDALSCDLTQGLCVAPGDGSVGTPCTQGGTCSGSLVCNPYLAACSTDALCHLFDDETDVQCAGRDFYVAPDGMDTASGTSPQDPTATLAPYSILPGDRFHLAPGEYSENVVSGQQVGGAPGCPIQLFGPDAGVDGGGMAIFLKPTSFSGDWWWLHDVRFQVTVGQPALEFGGSDMRLERLVMRNQYPDNTFPRDFTPAFNCDQATIIDCDVNSVNSQVMEANSTTNLQIIGNHIVANAAAQLEIGSGTFIEGNDFTGAWGSPLVAGTAGQGLVVVRNVFHDLVGIDGDSIVLVDGADDIRSNTFLNVAQGTVATTGTFRDNLVWNVGNGTQLSADAADAGYNLFENVTQPYASGAGIGDQSGPGDLDPNDVPLPGSAAYGTADPALPVPPGGGTRADIGARQHGATLLPDGRYCMDGGG
jgi:hypothetical protein